MRGGNTNPCCDQHIVVMPWLSGPLDFTIHAETKDDAREHAHNPARGKDSWAVAVVVTRHRRPRARAIGYAVPEKQHDEKKNL